MPQADGWGEQRTRSHEIADRRSVVCQPEVKDSWLDCSLVF